MATSRSQMPKQTMPFGEKKAAPFGGKKAAPPFGKPKGNPFADKKAPPFGAKKAKGKPFGFAVGGSIAGGDVPTHKAAMASNPPSTNPLDDGKPSGGGQARGGGAAKKGNRFQGTF